MDIFEYDFMRRAFLVGILLAAIVPCVGTIIVLKRLSMLGDTLSHSSLAGVAIGLFLGINPTLGATLYCIAAALMIEFLRRQYPDYAELSLAIVMSTGIGLAGVMSGFISSSANFTSFLFGSIVAISDFELYLVLGTSVTVLITFLALYKELFYIAFDEPGARLAGIPVDIINCVFLVLTAVTVSVAARTVGALIVSSLMVIPVACSLQWARSYFQTIIFAVCFALLFVLSGLFISFYSYAKPGGTIVLIGVAGLIASIFFRHVLASGRR